MNSIMVLGSFLPTGLTTAMLSATLMMTVVGAVTAVLLSRVSVQSWRLQSCLVAAVLLQGVMLIRSPVHLGWIPAKASSSPIDTKHDIQLAANELAASGLGPGAHKLESSTAFASSDQPRTATTPWWPSWRGVNWWSIVTTVWLAGIAILSAIALVGYLRMIRLAGKLPEAPTSWQAEWKRLALHRSVRCQMRVSQSVGPLMLRRPLGYLLIVPRDYWNGLNDDQRRGVMLHELAHLQRRDVWRQFLARGIGTIHWFNPMAWWAIRRYEQAAELACDQRVRSHGKRASAGFASALVQLLQWHQTSGTRWAATRGLGLQAMAAPPLTTRVSRLLQSDATGDSMMKRLMLALFAMGLVGVSLVQLKLTAQETEQDTNETPRSGSFVLQEATKQRLTEVMGGLDRADETTARFAALADTTAGEMALAGYLNALRNQETENARVDAVPRYLAKYFDKTADDHYKIRSDQTEMLQRWEDKSKRLQTAFDQAGAAMTDMASRMDTSNDVGAMMKRLLEDRQAPAALLLFEVKGGGDVISRYISEALGKVLVDRGDGSFQIVQSRRAEAEQQVEKLEAAERIRKKLLREFPLWAEELVADDDQHKKFVRYLNNPSMATVVAMILMKEHKGNPAMAVEKLFQSLEESATETATGLKVTNPEVWQRLDEIFGHVDRVGGLLPRIQERLTEIGETLADDDPLSARLAKQMAQAPLAAALAAELPYANADTGEQLRALLSEVVSETPDKKLKVRADKEEELGKKITELLRVCRQIRRYVRTVDDVLEKLEDQSFVTRIGDAGRYLFLDEIRRFGESQQPDPLALMQKDLLAENDQGKLRVRAERREIVRQLVEQAEKVRVEEANDDF